MLVVAWLHILIILRKIFFTLVECDAGVESALDKHTLLSNSIDE